MRLTTATKLLLFEGVVHMHVCVLTCGGQRLALGIGQFLRHCPSCLFDTGSDIGIQGFPIRPHCLAREPQGSSSLFLTSAGTYVGAPLHLASYVGAGDHTEASFLHSKHFNNSATSLAP